MDNIISQGSTIDSWRNDYDFVYTIVNLVGYLSRKNNVQF